MKNKVLDHLQRPLRDLRLSVTDKCNFRCRYCMPAEVFGPDYPFLQQQQLLTFEELTRLTRIFCQLGVEKVRITGGEPLMRRDLPTLIQLISEINEVKDIAMTTNGSLLTKYAHQLKRAGLHRVTVSLDSLDDDTFTSINDRGYTVQQVLGGIDAAQNVGLAVKVNMVVQKGVNDQDILPMATYFKKKNIPLRLIEFMDVGNTNGWRMDQVISSAEIVQQINDVMPIEPVDPQYYGEVASRYRYKGTDQEIGLISSVTQPFCSTCTRARVSAEGRLYTCLFASKGFDLREFVRNGSSDETIQQYLIEQWNRRKDQYSEDRKAMPSDQSRTKKKIEMSHIGG